MTKCEVRYEYFDIDFNNCGMHDIRCIGEELYEKQDETWKLVKTTFYGALY